MKRIPRNVFILGLVSFFNDLASEMVYPIIPIFLTSVLHASIPVIGLIEGIAEGVASISKYAFGAYSDYVRRRKPFVVGGYALSALSKLLIGMASAWPLVLVARIMDRLGKGLRTAPRDSLLLENATPGNKGFIFGFHRAFDSLGAVLGPLVSLVLLALLNEDIRLTFYVAFIPGLFAVMLLLFLLREKKKPDIQKKEMVRIPFFRLDRRLKIFLLVSFIFSLANSSDAFLLLHAKNLGLTTTLVVLAYVLYNVFQTVFATPLGVLSDKIGAATVYSFGLLMFSLLYFLFGFVREPVYLWVLFPLYGLYIAATDGVSKSYISDFISKKESGTYFGAYYTLTAIGTFLASLIGGILWSRIAPSATFYYGSALSFAAFLVYVLSVPRFRMRRTLPS